MYMHGYVYVCNCYKLSLAIATYIPTDMCMPYMYTIFIKLLQNISVCIRVDMHKYTYVYMYVAVVIFSQSQFWYGTHNIYI